MQGDSVVDDGVNGREVPGERRMAEFLYRHREQAVAVSGLS